MSEVIKSSEKSNSGPTVIVNQQEKESNEVIKSSEKSNLGPTIIVNQQERKSNGLGTAGFILAVIALFIGWLPFGGWIVWALGLIFSFIGVFKTPRGMAIAGLVISLIVVILLITVFATLAALIFGDAGFFSGLFSELF